MAKNGTETVHAAQIQLVPAQQVAREVAARTAANGLRYAPYGDTRVTDADLTRMVESVPKSIADALTQKAYYFVPLTLGDGLGAELGIELGGETLGETLVAPAYTMELGDRAVCHRNVAFGKADCVFISTQLMDDRFALAFEFAINIGHAFVDAAGVPESFAELAWRQAEAHVKGETSHDAWENRNRALAPSDALATKGRARVDEKAKNIYIEAAFADAIAIYLLSLTVDFDYAELREREYPLLAPQALAERLKHVAALFPPNAGYSFAVLYRRKA
jgi:hypothetical protein